MLAASAVVLGVFAIHQRRRKASGRTPLVELSVFAKRSYTSGTLFVLVFFGAIVGFSLAVGLFLQLGLGYSPVRASVTMSAWAIGAFLGSGFSAGAMAKLGRRILHLGLALMTVGLILLYAMFSAHGTGIGGWSLALPLFAYGLGMGMIFVPLFDVIMGDIADHEVGSASGVLESIQQLGSSLGVAALGTVFFTAAGATGQAAGFLLASQRVTLVTVALTALAFGLAFLLPRKARSHGAPQQQEQPTPAVTTPEREPALV
jgi:MFS family permease